MTTLELFISWIISKGELRRINLNISSSGSSVSRFNETIECMTKLFYTGL